MSSSPARVACIIPARDGQQRVAATGEHAAAAGAVVVTHHCNRGKAAVVDSAVNPLGVLEQRGTGGVVSRGLSSLRARRTRER